MEIAKNNIPTLKEIVRENTVAFSHYRKGFFYYTVIVKDVKYCFPVPIDDIGDATLLNYDKASLFMRYIRKAIDDSSFIVSA